MGASRCVPGWCLPPLSFRPTSWTSQHPSARSLVTTRPASPPVSFNPHHHQHRQHHQVPDLYDPRTQWASYIINAIKAKELFVKDVNYIVKNNEVGARWCVVRWCVVLVMVQGGVGVDLRGASFRVCIAEGWVGVVRATYCSNHTTNQPPLTLLPCSINIPTNNPLRSASTTTTANHTPHTTNHQPPTTNNNTNTSAGDHCR